MSTIGFIGTGHMGGALARAAAKSEHSVLLYDKNTACAQSLATDIKATACTCAELVQACDMIFIGVKPQVLDALAKELRPLLEQSERKCLVSFLAGVSLARLQEALGEHAMIRMMPNVAVSVGQGMVVYCTNAQVSKEQRELFTALMSHAGKTDELSESLIDAATAVMGCGPAYADLFMEALSDGGVKCGLPRDKALLYAEQMLRGSAELALHSGQHPAALKDAVCSPGGSTIVGVAALEGDGFRGAVMHAVEASYQRTKQLGQ